MAAKEKGNSKKMSLSNLLENEARALRDVYTVKKKEGGEDDSKP